MNEVNNEASERSETERLQRVVMPIDLTIINSKDVDTLAKWNCLMNHWGWPEELPDEPNDKGSPFSESEPLHRNRRTSLMQIIEDKIGHERISWEWNKDRMSKEEFRDFYDGTYKKDKAAKKRDVDRTMDKITQAMA